MTNVWRDVDFARYPERYRVGRGEQGVLTAEPYKSRLLPMWRFATPRQARASAREILRAFHAYRRVGDFVGMDMARKYLQMGYTRSRRYANHKSGHKYRGAVPSHLRGVSGAHGRAVLPRDPDPVKAHCAEIFRVAWRRAESNPTYRRIRRAWPK